MTQARRRNKAKQARRDARRRKSERRRTHDRAISDAAPPTGDEPEGLIPRNALGVVSSALSARLPRPFAKVLGGEQEQFDLDGLITGLIDSESPTSNAVLAVFGELVAADDPLRARCLSAIADRRDELPSWITELGQTTVYRAVRAMDVLGDFEFLLLGARLAGDEELTCVVRIDHLRVDGVNDAYLLSRAVGEVVAEAEADGANPDATFADIEVADARAALQKALDAPLVTLFLTPTDTWPGCWALVQWICRLMPEGGVNPLVQSISWGRANQVIEQFFASPAGRPFDFFDERSLLDEAIEAGTGDPFRWSAPRLRLLLKDVVSNDEMIEVAAHFAVPAMLSAYVPFVHAQLGIRQELTDEALAEIHDMTDRYRAKVREWLRWRGGEEDELSAS